MRKFKLIDQGGFVFYKQGEIYKYDECLPCAESVKHLVKAFPERWEEVFDDEAPHFGLPTSGKKMLVWDGDESNATEMEVIAYMKEYLFPYVCIDGDGEYTPYKHAKPIPERPEIEITVKVNGKEAKLSDISDETLKTLKEKGL